MPKVVLASLGGPSTRASVLGHAKLLASMCAATTTALHVAEAHNVQPVGELAFAERVGLHLVDGDRVREIVRAAENPSVQFVVVGTHRAPDGRGPGFVTQEIAARLRQPLLVVPAGARVPKTFERVLFPLEGTIATTDPISALLEHLSFAPGTDLVAVHSIAYEDASPFADHEPYDTESLIDAFTEHLPPGFAGGVVMRAGPPERVVPEVAADLDATLIVVSWSQSFDPGRAALVTKLLAHPTRPALLVPVRYGTSHRTGAIPWRGSSPAPPSYSESNPGCAARGGRASCTRLQAQGLPASSAGRFVPGVRSTSERGRRFTVQPRDPSSRRNGVDSGRLRARNGLRADESPG